MTTWILYIDTYLEPSPFGQLFLQESGNHCPIEAIKTQISTGWWFGTWLWFFHILGIVTPTDFHIFQRGRYTTNQSGLYSGFFLGAVCSSPSCGHDGVLNKEPDSDLWRLLSGRWHVLRVPAKRLLGGPSKSPKVYLQRCHQTWLAGNSNLGCLSSGKQPHSELENHHFIAGNIGSTNFRLWNMFKFANCWHNQRVVRCSHGVIQDCDVWLPEDTSLVLNLLDARWDDQSRHSSINPFAKWDIWCNAFGLHKKCLIFMVNWNLIVNFMVPHVFA